MRKNDAASNGRRNLGPAHWGLRSWRTKDVGARTLGREDVRPRGAGQRRGDGRRGEEARRDGHPLPRQGGREAARGRAGAGPERRLVGGRPVVGRGVVALARPVRIHRAEALRVGALMVRGGPLDLVDDRPERERLQAHHEDEQERKHPQAVRSPLRREGHRHGRQCTVRRECLYRTSKPQVSFAAGPAGQLGAGDVPSGEPTGRPGGVRPVGGDISSRPPAIPTILQWTPLSPRAVRCFFTAFIN